MSAAQYFDLQNSQSEEAHFGVQGEPAISPLFRTAQTAGATNRLGEVKPLSLTFQEVMFTSRVPVSTWTFAFAVNEKLWVSDLTTLYFGKRTEFEKKIYRGKMFIPDRGGVMTIGITAYNSYGDLFNTTRDLRVFTDNKANTAGGLVKIDEDWTQLLFKFHVHIER